MRHILFCYHYKRLTIYVQKKMSDLGDFDGKNQYFGNSNILCNIYIFPKPCCLYIAI